MGLMLELALPPKGFNAGVVFPISAFPAELLEAYPDAKFILAVRSGKGWFKSIDSTICNFGSEWRVCGVCVCVWRVCARARVSCSDDGTTAE